MTLDVPIAITLFFIWALLAALGFDRNFKILPFNHNYERPEHGSKWKAFDTVSSKLSTVIITVLILNQSEI